MSDWSERYIRGVEERFFNEQNFDGKVALAQYLGFLETSRPTGSFDGIAVEREMISSLVGLLTPSLANQKHDRTLHIVTIPYLHGGHTRLCERLGYAELNRPDVLVTQPESATLGALERLGGYFSSVLTVKSNSCLDRAKQIANLVSCYSTIVLHIHPNDILTVAAIGVIKAQFKFTVFFVDHADHLFTFGVSVIDVKLCISYRGMRISSRSGAGYIHSFMGIPIPKLKVRQARPEGETKISHVVMAGASYKMKPNKYGSAAAIINYLMRKDDAVKVTIIGALLVRDYWWWRTFFRYHSRIKFVRTLPVNEYYETLRAADACIDTFPIIGGTAFVEQYNLGLRPFGLDSGFRGCTPFDGLKPVDIESVFDFVAPSNIDEEIEVVHGVDAVKARYLDALSGIYHEPPAALTRYGEGDLDIFSSDARWDFCLKDAEYLIYKINNFHLRDMHLIFKCFTWRSLALYPIKALVKRLLALWRFRD